MYKKLFFLIALAAFAAFCYAKSERKVPVLLVVGDVPKQLRLTIVDLQQFTHVQLELKEHDGTVNTFEGAPLNEVLASAGLQMAEHMRGKELAEYVLADGQDGYEVVYGMGETEPSISGRTIIVAWSSNGKPLGASVGPLRIVVEGDKKQARCIRMLTKLTVKKP